MKNYNYHTCVETFVRKRIEKEKLEVQPEVILNNPELRAQAEQMMHEHNEELREKFIANGESNPNRYNSEYQSEQAKKFWDNPDYEEKQKEVIAKFTAQAKENGHKVGGSPEGRARMAKLGRKYAHIGLAASLKKIKCEKCGMEVSTGNYARHHGDKCQFDDIMEVFNELPLEFTRKDVKAVIKKVGARQGILRKIVNDNYLDMIKVIHEGTNGSCYDVPIYRKVKFVK